MPLKGTRACDSLFLMDRYCSAARLAIRSYPVLIAKMKKRDEKWRGVLHRLMIFYLDNLIFDASICTVGLLDFPLAISGNYDLTLLGINEKVPLCAPPALSIGILLK